MNNVTINCVFCGYSRQLDAARVPAGEIKVTCPKCKMSFPFRKDEGDFSFRASPDQTQSPSQPQAEFPARASTVQPPQAPVSAPPSVRFAGFWIRLLAYIIDNLIWLVVFLMLAVPLGLASVFTALSGGDDVKALFAVGGIVVALFAVAVGSVFYYVLCWKKWGRTLGMRVAGIKVIDYKGDLLVTSNAFLRWLMGYMLPGMIPYIGALAYLALGIMIGVNEKKQGWHDLLAKSYVVYG